jgi:hypothetical protein
MTVKHERAAVLMTFFSFAFIVSLLVASLR